MMIYLLPDYPLVIYIIIWTLFLPIWTLLHLFPPPLLPLLLRLIIIDPLLVWTQRLWYCSVGCYSVIVVLPDLPFIPTIAS